MKRPPPGYYYNTSLRWQRVEATFHRHVEVHQQSSGLCWAINSTPGIVGDTRENLHDELRQAFRPCSIYGSIPGFWMLDDDVRARALKLLISRHNPYNTPIQSHQVEVEIHSLATEILRRLM